MARQTLEDLRVQHEGLRKRKGIGSSTLASERSSCRHLCTAWDNTRRAPSSLGRDWMEDYLFGVGGVSELVSEASFNKRVSHLKTFVEWLVRRGELRTGDVLDVMTKLKVTTKRYARLPLGAMHQMVNNAEDPWDRFVLAFGIHTLGRWSELRIVQRRHVKLDAGYVEWWREKTDEWDELPITPMLDAELRRWIVAYEREIGRELEPDDYMIPCRQPGGFRVWQYCYAPKYRATEAIRTCVKTHAAPHVGGLDVIKGQGVHILRRSAAREMYEALKRRGVGDPLRSVMAMLGHKNIRTTEIYLGIDRDRETRDTLLREQDWFERDTTTNVVELRMAGNGG